MTANRTTSSPRRLHEPSSHQTENLGKRETCQSTTNQTSEPGNLLILGLGIWLVIVALLAILASISSAQVARKDLLAQADALALDVASRISEASYYSPDGLAYSAGELRSAAEASAKNHLEPGVTIVAVNVEGSEGALADGATPSVVVTLTETFDLPFVPNIVDGVGRVDLTVTSRARLRQMD